MSMQPDSKEVDLVKYEAQDKIAGLGLTIGSLGNASAFPLLIIAAIEKTGLSWTTGLVVAAPLVSEGTLIGLKISTSRMLRRAQKDLRTQ